MDELKLNGCGTALVTPFGIDFNVDYEAFRKLVKRQIESGIHFLVPLGTTGETVTLEVDEKLKILEITMEEALAGRIPVIVGAGSNNTAKVIADIGKFERFDVDGFLIVTPYYNKPTQQGLYNHFKDIAGSTDKMIVMYNVPSRTAVNMTAETALRLAEIPNIIATKEASSDYSQINEIIRNAPAGFTVLSGNDIETLPLCVTGAKGVISVASNIAPAEMSDLLNLILDEKFIAAREFHHRLTPLFENCFIESNPIPVKAGMNSIGLLQNILRPPLFPAAENTFQIMRETLIELNITG
jgi:4-hydroxy-tetrahydrodipicolinate synthase